MFFVNISLIIGIIVTERIHIRVEFYDDIENKDNIRDTISLYLIVEMQLYQIQNVIGCECSC